MHPPILVSYAYLKDRVFRDLLIATLTEGVQDVMIDSGAFTAHKLGVRISLGAYIECCKRLLEFPNVWGCVMLDKIGNEEQTRRNLDIMVRAGVRPMPVLTIDSSISLLDEYTQINNRVCLAGGVGSFVGHRNWVANRFKQAVAQYPKAEFHGLGYVKHPDMFSLRLRSVDSSSNSAGGRYGTLGGYNCTSGIMSFPAKDTDRSTAWNDIGKQFRTYLDGCGITRLQWSDEKTMRTGGMSFCAISYTASSVAQSLYADKVGLKLFQAVACASIWVRCVVATRHLRQGGCVDYWAARRDMLALLSLPMRARAAAVVAYIKQTDQQHAEQQRGSLCKSGS
jgi:hypothetical protein